MLAIKHFNYSCESHLYFKPLVLLHTMWLDHQGGVTSTIFILTTFAKQINENSNEHYGINNLPQPIFEAVGTQVNVSNETNSADLPSPAPSRIFILIR